MKIKESDILKYLNGTANDAESAAVDAWIQLNPENKIEFDRLQKVWSHLEDMGSYKTPFDGSSFGRAKR